MSRVVGHTENSREQRDRPDGRAPRTREAFACGVDGVILKVQPPTVVLAVIEALYTPAKSHVHLERNGVGRMGIGTSFTKAVEATQPPAWPDP